MTIDMMTFDKVAVQVMGLQNEVSYSMGNFKIESCSIIALCEMTFNKMTIDIMTFDEVTVRIRALQNDVCYI